MYFPNVYPIHVALYSIVPLGSPVEFFLHDLESFMVQVTKYSMPQLTDVLSLHLLLFSAQSSIVFYLQFVEVIQLNPNPLHLSYGYVMKEGLSFTKYHVIASILQHGNIKQVLLQT